MITIYSREGCTRCVFAKNLIRNHEIEYQEIMIDRDITREQVLELFPTGKQLPILEDPKNLTTIAQLKPLREFVMERVERNQLDRAQLEQLLKQGIVRVGFVKKNEEEREMFCTLNQSFIEVETVATTAEFKLPRERPEGLITVWDTGSKDFRSFYYDSLISVYHMGKQYSKFI